MLAIASSPSKAVDPGLVDECLVLGTGVNGLLIGQREPREVESTNPFPNPGQDGKGPSRALTGPAR